ncbi:MAG: glycosyltransferase family 2 protein [Methanothrix sp.]
MQEHVERREGGWPKVAIIILNWNNYPISSRCLISLKGIMYPFYTIYLVDNNSQDKSREQLYKEFQDIGVRFIFNNSNLGFAAGCNQGIRVALEDGNDYVLLLNNDCKVYNKDFLNYGVDLAESDPRCGIVGGKILFWPDTKRIWSTGGYVTFWGGEKHIGYGEIDKGQYDKIAERSFISGALMLIKRKVFDCVGLLPDAYFFGKEEWEFSTRAVGAGFRLIYHPKFTVYHEASSSHEWTDPTYIYNGTLSKILYKRRNIVRWKFRLWFFVYKAYLNYFFPVRYCLKRSSYLQKVPPETLHHSMLHAVRDIQHTERITEEILVNYRSQYCPTNNEVE